MSRNEAINEHKNLVKVLRRGSKKALLKEAIKQAEELREYESGGSEETE